MTYFYQNTFLFKVTLIVCVFFCTKILAFPGLDDYTDSRRGAAIEASRGGSSHGAVLSFPGRGALPTDSEPPEVRSFGENEGDPSNPIDMREGYIRKYDPVRHMYYYEEKSHWSIQALKDVLWRLLGRH